MKKHLISLLCLVSMAVSANLREYNASVENSEWFLGSQTRLVCELKHPIPGYGTASFVAEASKQLNLEFMLDMLRLPNHYDTATVYSVPPKWMPGVTQKTIGIMNLRKQYDSDLPSESAWTILTELEKGFWPTIHYQDWNNRYDSVAVALNSSNFDPSYIAFSQCVTNLLPFSFEDIAYTVLSYQKSSVELTHYSKRRLDMIGDYLKEDVALELVLLDGYSDSYGGAWNNEQLSIRRANEIRDYFAAQGVDTARIEVTGHGEKRHVSPNDNELSRAQNRRVIIQLAKL
ncbi:MAG: outer membrane protein OmpA-like peptidoglycan-associated protein [Congregibacter sp.]|jgi:outer membrane protein OmpA-like peptidoglycan-associated protein